LQTKKCGIRAQYCLLKWWPGRPNFVFGDQNVNLVASVTTSIIEVGDRKFWIIFHQREKEYLFLLVYLVSLATNCFLLWPLKFEFGHQIFEVAGQLPTKIKIPL
jgi:hypothetical protein